MASPPVTADGHDRWVAAWEQRWHPLRGEWVLFTSHRAGRPWIGEMAAATALAAPEYDPACTLCPGNIRVSGEVNPDYRGPWAFTNDLPCFAPEAPVPGGAASSSGNAPGDPLYRTRPALGTAEVVCHHPQHHRSLADLSTDDITAVVALWAERSISLAARPEVASVLIFENRGSIVGTSNPHPHAQIYAGGLVYGHFEREWDVARAQLADTGEPIGMAVVRREQAAPRLLAETAGFIACIPWFARYAYEVLVLPTRPLTSLGDLTTDDQEDLAAVIGTVVRAYDALWDQPMPYVMAVHQAPCDGRPTEGYPFHLEFHPPLRKPDTLKYLAGPEIGGGSMTNESDPDEKAAELTAAMRRSTSADPSGPRLDRPDGGT